MSRINKTFAALRKKNQRAFIPYIMAGDPDLGRTALLVAELERAGSDIIELGVPFSDPLADGPVIQQAAERALGAGVTLRKVIAFVDGIRKTTQIPIVLMTYYNPVFKYGLEAFARDAAGAGVDGLIVPDLPPDEAGDLIPHCRACGLDTIFLFAPTSTEGRRKLVAKSSRGFIYYVSMTGITGARLTMESEAAAHVESARVLGGGRPVCVGFGVSTPEEARTVAAMADGVIVGSAIVKRATLSRGGPDFGEFVSSLVRAVREA